MPSPYNNHAISILWHTGADYRLQDLSGKCAFDYILDHKEWIESGHFNDEVRARLKGI